MRIGGRKGVFPTFYWHRLSSEETEKKKKKLSKGEKKCDLSDQPFPQDNRQL